VAEISNYGVVVRQYSVPGKVALGKHAKIKATCSISQYSDSRIYLGCSFYCPKAEYDNIVQIIHAYMPTSRHKLEHDYKKLLIANFEGQTAEGYICRIDRMYLIGAVTWFPIEGIKFELNFMCKEVEITAPASTETDSIRFSLTNLECGTKSYNLVCPSESETSAMQDSIQASESIVTLRPVKGYRDLLRELHITKGINVTCVATTKITRLNDILASEDRIENICLLLTLASGTHVTWINLDVLSTSGTTLYTRLRYTNTKGFEADALISTSADQLITRFFASAIRRLAEARLQWHIHEVIEIYTDAKLSTNLLVTRSLKLAICVEALKAAFIKRRSNGERILPGRIPKNINERIQNGILDILVDFLTAEEAVLPPALERNIKSLNLNRLSFRDTLAEMCESLGLPVNEQDLRKLSRIRNSLVHEGTFARDEGEPYEQYEF
jgi:hypothetical protein